MLIRKSFQRGNVFLAKPDFDRLQQQGVFKLGGEHPEMFCGGASHILADALHHSHSAG